MNDPLAPSMEEAECTRIVKKNLYAHINAVTQGREGRSGGVGTWGFDAFWKTAGAKLSRAMPSSQPITGIYLFDSEKSGKSHFFAFPLNPDDPEKKSEMRIVLEYVLNVMKTHATTRGANMGDSFIVWLGLSYSLDRVEAEKEAATPSK